MAVEVRGLVPLLSVLSVVILAGMAGAGREEGTETIDAEDHLKVVKDDPDGKEIRVRYIVVVTEGWVVDVLVMGEGDYQDYMDGPTFDYYPGYSKVNTGEIDKTFVSRDDGELFFVIDNTGILTPPHGDPALENATVEYFVTWETVEEGDTGALYASMGIVVLAALFVLLVLYFHIFKGNG